MSALTLGRKSPGKASAFDLADRVAKTKADYEAEVARRRAALEAELTSHADDVSSRRSHVESRLAALEAEASVLKALEAELR